MIKENSLSAVLRVLSITVLIDSKIKHAEPSEFCKQVSTLKVFLDDLSEEDWAMRIEDWCDENWNNIRQKLANDNHGEYVENSLKAINDEFLMPMLYASMNQICRCDNEMHASEDSLLDTAAKIWQLK